MGINTTHTVASFNRKSKPLAPFAPFGPRSGFPTCPTSPACPTCLPYWPGREESGQDEGEWGEMEGRKRKRKGGEGQGKSAHHPKRVESHDETVVGRRGCRAGGTLGQGMLAFAHFFKASYCGHNVDLEFKSRSLTGSPFGKDLFLMSGGALVMGL